MAEPRIMFVTRKWAPAVGGMEVYSMRLTDTLAQIEPIEVVALPGKTNGMPPSAKALLAFPFRVLLALMRRQRMPAVLHLGDMALWPLGLLPALFLARTQIVLSAHGTDVAYHRRGGVKGRLYGLYLKLGSRLLGRASVIANSHATVKVAAETGWHGGHIVPLATDLHADAIGAHHNGRLLFVGRLVERKGCGWFIRHVLPLLPETIELDVAGTGWDPEEAAALATPRVRHLGSLHGQELVDAYGSAMAVIVPNIEPTSGEYEGFGLVAPEAAACGGLVLASRSGGLTDAVIEGKTGILIASADPQAWADEIVEIAGWTAARHGSFRQEASHMARSHFVWGRVARDTHALYALD